MRNNELRQRIEAILDTPGIATDDATPTLDLMRLQDLIPNDNLPTPPFIERAINRLELSIDYTTHHSPDNQDYDDQLAYENNAYATIHAIEYIAARYTAAAPVTNAYSINNSSTSTLEPTGIISSVSQVCTIS